MLSLLMPNILPQKAHEKMFYLQSFIYKILLKIAKTVQKSFYTFRNITKLPLLVCLTIPNSALSQQLPLASNSIVPLMLAYQHFDV